LSQLKPTQFVPVLLLAYLSVACSPALAQSRNYMEQMGIPVFTTTEPVENGFINLANGNLHIEIPLTTVPERGGGRFTPSLVYDSRMWSVAQNQPLPGGGSGPAWV